MLRPAASPFDAYAPPPVRIAAGVAHWFRSGEDLCAAVWHPARSGGARVAVMCPSIAQEHLRGQRHYRLLAGRLADVGVSSLRFDYPASGNSTGSAILGDGEGPELVSRWSGSIGDAVAHARQLSPGAEIVLIARRAAALLLGPAAADCDACVLWDPSVSGQAHLRELQLREAARLDVLFAGELDRTEPGVAFQTEGHRYSRATIDAFSRLSLDARPPRAPVTHVVGQLGPRVRRALSAWDDVDAAPRVELHATADASFDWANPEGPLLPEMTLRALERIVCANLPMHSAGTGSRALHSEIVWTTSSGASVREQMVRFGEADELFAVHTMPAADHAVRSAVLVLGTGVEPSPGFGDSWARFARAAAPHGIAVLRMDFRGNGESAVSQGGRENVTYLRGRVDDVRDGVAWLSARWPGVPVVVAGICTGGYYGVHAAAAGIPIDRVIAINPQLWCTEDATTTTSLDPAVLLAQRSTDALADPGKWKRLLRGGYRPADIALALRGFVQRIVGTLRTAGQREGDLGGGLPRLDFERLFPARVRMHLVFSQDDFGYQHLVAHGRRQMRRLLARPRLRMHVIERVDHTFSREWMRRRLDDEVLAILAEERG